MKPKPIALVDAQQMSRTFPEFWVPPSCDLSKLQAGDLVKVCNDRERFWVQIVSRRGSIFMGRIDNRLLYDGPNLDDLIEFHECNIYEIHDGLQSFEGGCP